MAFTLEQYNALDAAISVGANRVKYADKEVEYRSLQDMLQLRNQMRDELGLNGADPNGYRRRFAQFSKGLK
jgi:hypothetical protein